MTSLRLAARAKVNLVLRVLGREPDGYHSIETLFLLLELADRVDLAPGRGLRLSVTGDPGVPSDASNLAWKAAELLFEAVGRSPSVSIRLEKRIPAAGGLGGGSADAAAVLRGVNRLLGEPLAYRDLLELAGEIGSDVPFALSEAVMAFAWERGRRLLPLPPPPPRPALLLAPPFAVSAGEAYGWLAEDRGAAADRPARSEGGKASAWPPSADLAAWEALRDIAQNDLEAPVMRRHPILRDGLALLAEAGAAPALMCGSGSCLVGIFEREEQRDRAAAVAEESLPFRILRTRTAG